MYCSFSCSVTYCSRKRFFLSFVEHSCRLDGAAWNELGPARHQWQSFLIVLHRKFCFMLFPLDGCLCRTKSICPVFRFWAVCIATKSALISSTLISAAYIFFFSSIETFLFSMHLCSSFDWRVRGSRILSEGLQNDAIQAYVLDPNFERHCTIDIIRLKTSNSAGAGYISASVAMVEDVEISASKNVDATQNERSVLMQNAIIMIACWQLYKNSAHCTYRHTVESHWTHMWQYVARNCLLN